MHKKALEFERIVETCLVTGSGLLRSALDITTMKPFPPEYFTPELDIVRMKDADIYRHGGGWAGVMEYEDSGMVSGAYLCAQILKYAVTQEPAAREKAYRTFQGIKVLYDRCQSVEEGYFCKPYGNEITREISSDQYLYVLIGLDHFIKIAGEKERSEAVEMIAALTRYWVRHAYTHDYFSVPFQWPPNRFPGFCYLNYVHTGDRKMLEEFERIACLPEVTGTLPFTEIPLQEFWDEYRSGARELLPIEKKSGQMLMGEHTVTAQSGTLSIEPCLEYGAPHRDVWLRQLEQLFEAGAVCIKENGFSLRIGFYNHEQKIFTPVVPPAFVSDTPGLGYKILAYADAVYSGASAAMFARAAVYAHQYFPAREKSELAQRILASIGHDQMRPYIISGEHLPPDMRWHENIYSGDGVVNWLWAYWQGRYAGLW